MYDYNLGRFLSVDPFIHAGSQGINPYSYILNNPLAGTDPSGYKPCVDVSDNNCGGAVSFDDEHERFNISHDFGKEGLGYGPSKVQLDNGKIELVQMNMKDGYQLTAENIGSQELLASYLSTEEAGAPTFAAAVHPFGGAAATAFPLPMPIVPLGSGVNASGNDPTGQAERNRQLAIALDKGLKELAGSGSPTPEPDDEDSGDLFPNQMPDRLKQEMRVASENKVVPVRVGTKEFEALANQGRVKFAINKSGEIWAVPHTVNGVEISHAVILRGRVVRVAGEADIAFAGRESYGITLSVRSGHYHHGNSHSTNVRLYNDARQAFKDKGIEFKAGGPFF